MIILVLMFFMLAVSFIGVVEESTVRHDARELDLDLDEYLGRKGIK